MSGVLVAMSGGVDSSVAAALLVEAGHRVVGATLRLVSCQDEARSQLCCGVEAEDKARAVAGQLGIPHYVFDASQQFEQRVLLPAWQEYAVGHTPSPCPHCNRWLKFGLLLERALALGLQYVATGHYACREGSDENPDLCRGLDPRKDQSYFLFALSRHQLAHTLFPLGGLTKAETRQVARRLGLVNAERRGSQDACLRGPEGSFAEGLRLRFDAAARSGRVLDPAGKELGRHAGVHHFTVGQRRGIGVALGRPAWVSRVDGATGDITVSTDPADMLAVGLEADGLNWLFQQALASEPLHCQVQVRYASRAVPARLWRLPDGGVRVLFQEPLRAVTPGQAAVFYRERCVLGGGWIRRALRDSDLG